MKSIFKSAFYLRSNYVNKEGKNPMMLRIYLNNERLSIGSTEISVLKSLWDIDKERLKGRTTEVLRTNLQLDNISNGLLNIFRRLEFSDDLCLERIKEEFLGKKGNIDTFMALFDKHNDDFRKQVGISVSATTLRKYELCKRHFAKFLRQKYNRTDIKLCELTYTVIYEFDLYLQTVAGQCRNTTTKTMKIFKTITILGQKLGVLHHDPFAKFRFHMEHVDRDFLTDDEILKIVNKKLRYLAYLLSVTYLYSHVSRVYHI